MAAAVSALVEAPTIDKWMRIILGLVGLVYGVAFVGSLAMAIYYGWLTLGGIQEGDAIFDVAGNVVGFIGYTLVLFANAGICFTIAYTLIAARHWANRVIIPANSLYLLLFLSIASLGPKTTQINLRPAEVIAIVLVTGFLVGVPILCLVPSGRRALAN